MKAILLKTEQLIQIFSKERSDWVKPEEPFFLRVLAVLVRALCQNKDEESNISKS